MKNTYKNKYKFIVSNKKLTLSVLIIFTILLLLIAFFLHKGLTQNNNRANDENSIVYAPGQNGATNYSMNKVWQIDNFEIKINSYNDNVTQIDSDNTFTSENGKFVLVKLTIKNTSNKISNFLASQQKIKTNKNTYFNSVQASSLVNSNLLSTNLDIKPNSSKDFTLVFDIKTNEHPIELDFYSTIESIQAVIPLG